MQGKLGGDAEDNSVTAERVKKEITGLEKRKADLQVEIDKAVKEAVVKCEEDYAVKVKDLTATYQARLQDLENDKKAVARRDKELAAKDIEIIKRIDEMRQEEILIDEEQKRIAEVLQRIAVNENSAKVYIEGETQRFKAKEVELAAKEDALNERDLDLDGRSMDISDKERILKSVEKTLSNVKIELEQLAAELNIEKANLETLKDAAQSNLKQISVLKDEVTKELQRVVETKEKLVKDSIVLDESIKKNAELGKRLPELRSALVEKEISLKEKEKLLILKEREVDEKIKVLQKLRAET